MPIPQTMSAVQLVGHGGPEQLVYSDDVPVPLPADGEVLIDVHACGMNNTDVWVREGAYGSDTDPNEVSTWRRGRSTLEFPRIQGADIVGRIAGVGPGVDQDRIGERVMVDFSLYNRPEGDESLADIDYIGHGRDGGYADYVTVPAENAYEVTADVSDAGLATFCCAYLTAEQMLDRARLAAGERILVTGASGGVGSAVIQLARVRGAIPYAVTSVGKESALREIGAEGVLTRDTDDLVAEAARVIDGPVDVVADLVAGPLFNDLLRILRPEGRYTGSPTSSRPSAPSWASRTSASWWWCLTGTGMTWGHTMRRERSLDLIDAQSGGDVSRVVTAGIEPIPGATALEKARYLQREGDGLRRLLLSEPYGDPAMSVDLIVEPGHPEAQAGYIIMEAMGYPLYSGSNTICVATVLLQSGMIEMTEGLQDVVLESPAGLARVSARNVDGRVESITTQGEPAYVAERGLSVDVPDYGRVEFDLVWSGAYYAMIHAADHGFDLTPDEQIALTAFGDAFVRAARPGLRQEHPALGDVGPLPFAHFMGRVRTLENGKVESRSATYVHPGVICRSPTGTGTSARLALMAGQGDLGSGDTLETISPRGNRFVGTVLGEAMVGDFPAWHSTITGGARLLAHSRVTVDLDDPLVDSSDLEKLLSP